MAAQSSDMDDHKSGTTTQTEDQTLAPPNDQYGPKETEVFGSTPSHSPSKSLVRRPKPDCPETWYCLEIQITLTEEEELPYHLPHAWQAPVVMDMLHDSKAGLTEVIVMSVGLASRPG